MGETVRANPAMAPDEGRWRKLAGMGPTYGALIALILLVVVNAVFTANFATASNLWNVLLQVSTVLIVAVGMTLVIATGGIDLSVGSTMAIAGAVASVLIDRGLGVAIPVALLVVLVIGAINGALVAYVRVQPIVVTLATLIAGRGLAQVISRDGQLVTIDHSGFQSLGRGLLGPVPAPVIIAVLVVALAAFVLRATPFGRYVLASGGNPAAARLAGVPVARTIVSVYVASAVLAGLAGLIVAGRLGASDAA